jgi:hypothetical protein
MQPQGFLEPIEITQTTCQTTLAHWAQGLEHQGPLIGRSGGRRQISQPQRIGLIGSQAMVIRILLCKVVVRRGSTEPVTNLLLHPGLSELIEG